MWSTSWKRGPRQERVTFPWTGLSTHGYTHHVATPSTATPGAGSQNSSQNHVPGKPLPNAKPVLDPRFEDHAVFELKRTIQIEMENMIINRASAEERQKALRQLKFRWHPDKVEFGSLGGY